MKNIPLGIEDFASLIKTSYYVDHTRLIEKIESFPETSSILLLRPRRFGKSLHLSMLKYFYESDSTSRNNLFEGLYVANNKELMTSKTKPTIMLRLKDLKANNYDDFLLELFTLINKEYQTANDKYGINNTLTNDKKIDEIALKNSIYQLMNFIYNKTHQKVVILIDEYDTPISYAYNNGYYDKAIEFMRVFYGKILKGNEYLDRAVVTGVIKIAKESLFSDTNNLIVDDGIMSIFDEPCAFSYEETKELLSYYDALEEYEKIIKWYGGYTFNNQNYVNPWSVLSYLLYNKRFATYWSSTASNSELSLLINNDSLDVIYNLFNTKETLPIDFNESINYQNFNSSSNTLMQFLRSTGYLTVKEFTLDNKMILKIPNEEINITFPNEVVNRYMKDNHRLVLYEAKKAMINGDEKALETIIKENLLNALSYYEFGNEKVYQIMMLTLASLIFTNHIVYPEVNAGEGRCDIMISPKNEKDYGAIIEIKSLKAKTSIERMNNSSLNALEQIKKHRYHEELIKRNACPIYAYGICFYKNNIVIKSEKLR